MLDLKLPAGSEIRLSVLRQLRRDAMRSSAHQPGCGPGYRIVLTAEQEPDARRLTGFQHRDTYSPHKESTAVAGEFGRCEDFHLCLKS